jgi:hypothetical protein
MSDDVATIRKVLAVHDGSEFTADEFPTLRDGQAASTALAALAARRDALERDLRDAWVRELYVEEGARIWIADAEKKGHSVSQQLVRLEQLRTGAFA